MVLNRTNTPTPRGNTRAPMHQARRSSVIRSLAEAMLTAVWFGITAGLVEGAGLLSFQRLNWQRWAVVQHVTQEIIWISPIADVLLFVVMAMLVALLTQLIWRGLTLRAVVFLLTFLSIWDWLKLTDRLAPLACFLLALGISSALDRWFRKHSVGAVRFWKRSVSWLLFVWAATFAMTAGGRTWREHRELASLPEADPASPNVLFIVVDTLRADHLSPYGYSRPTPTMDRLAREGVLFQNLMAASSWTLPSHASLLTGRAPFEHGWTNVQKVPWGGWGANSMRGYRTLGEALEARGYRTAAFSANQLFFTSNLGFDRGFSRFEDFFQSPEDAMLRTLFGREFERAYLHRTERSKITRAIRWLKLTALLDNRKRAAEVNREATAWIAGGKSPFFAFLNYIDVHEAQSLQWPDSPPTWGMATRVDQYDSAVSYVDAQIGALLQWLDHEGILKNTLVVVTSDHGEGIGQHGAQFHGISLYLEQIHVPLLMRFPGRLPAGVKVSAPRSNTAVPGTIVDLVRPGAKNPFGTSLMSDFSGPIADHEATPTVFSELAKTDIDAHDAQARNCGPTSLDGDMKSVLTPQWHLIVHRTLGLQIFDWADDPAELHNLAHTPEGQAAAKSLMPELEKKGWP